MYNTFSRSLDKSMMVGQLSNKLRGACQFQVSKKEPTEQLVLNIQMEHVALQ